jgi:hypothetical protein
MKIEQQVCTLEQAKRLKELGVKQESLFYHYVTYSQKDGQSMGIFYTKADAEKKQHEYRYNWNCPTELFSAYTVAELGEILPSSHYSTNNEYLGWRCYNGDNKEIINVYANNEAECRAAAIIHLLEQKIITVEEINKRLASH